MRVLILSVLATAALGAADVPAFGRAGRLLRPAAMAAITRLAGGRELLALEVHRGQVLPEHWRAFVYLRAESERHNLRRGRVLQLETLVLNEVAQQWRVVSRAGQYAQVAIDGERFSQQLDSAVLDRPLHVVGRFTDVEILEIVAYVRSSPRRSPSSPDSDGTVHLELPVELEGHLPIVQLHRNNRSTVEVWLADDHYSGRHAVLHHRAERWHVGEIRMYIV